VTERIETIRRGLALGANVEANKALIELEFELGTLRLVNEIYKEEIEEWIETSHAASECITRLRKENEVAGELIVELAQAHVEAMQRNELLEEVLQRIADDSRPCNVTGEDTISLSLRAEHWKHVASQRREWAIEALHHLSLEDTNDGVSA
jgi:hypothetical protein